MPLESVLTRLGGSHDALAALEAVAERVRPDAVWSPARISVEEALWGEGFLFPGGAEETMRLVRPLGLAPAATLLLVGAGSGGPPQAIASQLGVWVSGFEANPDLAALGMERITRARLGRRAQIEMWYPSVPSFRANAYHHGLAIEPLRDAPAEPVLAAVAGALRPGGQLALIEMVAEEPLDPADPLIAEWSRLERRSPDLPSERGITRMLGRLGFDVRITEDVTQRHSHLAVLGWRAAVRAIQGARPSPSRAALLVEEAELWLLRLKLMRERRLRMVRWHAISGRRELG